MTHRERFIKTLKCEKIGGQVPTFELVFFLTMEAFRKVHPSHRVFSQWDQMSAHEQDLQITDLAETYIMTAERYDHSAIFVHGGPDYTIETFQRVLERIRELSGDEYYLMAHGDPTFAIPNGDNMMEFSARMFEDPDSMHEEAKRNLEHAVNFAQKITDMGHLLDGWTLCSDYCFNVNPFYSPDMFGEFIAPYLKEVISEYHKQGYYVIKHTDGNIMPIVKQMADCGPDAIHSLDPQGGVSIPEVRKIIGDDICLIGNVNCGLLQTGSEEEYQEDVMRSLREGMERGYGYVFCTSNCAYTGLSLDRYEGMIDIWRKYGNYENYDQNFRR